MEAERQSREIVPVLPERVKVQVQAEDNVGKRKQAFLNLVAMGVPVRYAAEHCFLTVTQVNHWTQPGCWQFDAEFGMAYRAARAEAVVRRIRKLNASDDWKAHAFLLQAAAEEFAPRKPEVKANDEAKPKDGGLVMNSDTIKALSEAHTKMMERLAKKETEQ